ncbi:hypothetical protein [Mycoplasma suis]|uniref:Uncharacterized protein n=2 Tax=Mycoplasma suis TaxID=57372 RepID=F0QQU9_MYCSL|nr:hypothetical protein [Mycoplasma suis]ADX97869.1 hypothetical protein MSU_0327 [Mycoplasma suis str. Illinois]CBZ40369.1 hypothetical protein MSUIS_02760 [Mycoplasma suis KI3806]
MLIKTLAVLIASAGAAVPAATAIKDSVFPSSHSTLKNSKSIVRVSWVGKGVQQEVGNLINGFGKMIHNENSDIQVKGEVIGLQLETSGTFNENICKDLGFDSEDKKSGLACEQSRKG